MITRNENGVETRSQYLQRACIAFFEKNPEACEFTIDYDETTCDGACLAEDLENALLEDSPSPQPCSAVECWARHTIIDGKVVTYSTSFDGDGKFPNPKKATGHFEISASRNSVMVHRATIQTDWQLETFKSALAAANRMHCELSACDGRPEWNQPNVEHSHE